MVEPTHRDEYADGDHRARNRIAEARDTIDGAMPSPLRQSRPIRKQQCDRDRDQRGNQRHQRTIGGERNEAQAEVCVAVRNCQFEQQQCRQCKADDNRQQTERARNPALQTGQNHPRLTSTGCLMET